VYLRVQALLQQGEWQIARADDGLLLLRRSSEPTSTALESASTPPPANPTGVAVPALVSAELVPSPDGAIDVDGPRWILRTTWQTAVPLAAGTRLDYWIELASGERLHVWDLAELWWNPPDRWSPGQPVTVHVPGIPIHDFRSWSATWSPASWPATGWP
jgi:hypothetical protein